MWSGDVDVPLDQLIEVADAAGAGADEGDRAAGCELHGDVGSVIENAVDQYQQVGERHETIAVLVANA